VRHARSCKPQYRRALEGGAGCHGGAKRQVVDTLDGDRAVGHSMALRNHARLAAAAREQGVEAITFSLPAVITARVPGKEPDRSAGEGEPTNPQCARPVSFRVRLRRRTWVWKG